MILDNCEVVDTLSEQSLFQITFSSIKVKNSILRSNYAKLSAHVFSLIQSSASIQNTLIDNSLNDLNIPYGIIMSQDGLATLNQQSQVYFEKTTIKGMRALQYAILQAYAESIVVINGSSRIENCTNSYSAISILQAVKFEIHDTTI